MWISPVQSYAMSGQRQHWASRKPSRFGFLSLKGLPNDNKNQSGTVEGCWAHNLELRGSNPCYKLDKSVLYKTYILYNKSSWKNNVLKFFDSSQIFDQIYHINFIFYFLIIIGTTLSINIDTYVNWIGDISCTI